MPGRTTKTRRDAYVAKMKLPIDALNGKLTELALTSKAGL